MNGLIQQIRADSEAQIQQTNGDRDELINKLKSLESAYDTLKDKYNADMNTMEHNLESFQHIVQELKKELMCRGDKYVLMLNTVKKALGITIKEACELREKYQFISLQHNRLMSLLKQLSKVPAGTNQDALLSPVRTWII